MSEIGLFFSSTTGNTEEAADAIKAEFDNVQPNLVAVHHVADGPLDDLLEYDKIILGVPTWDLGELEADWDAVASEFGDLDLTGKLVAIFGLGDQIGYADTYQDGIGILARKALDAGATVVGYTTTEGHEFEESYALEDDQFMGLALDVDNQPELSPERIADWVAQLIEEFELAVVVA